MSDHLLLPVLVQSASIVGCTPSQLPSDLPIFDLYLPGPPGLLRRDFLGNFRVQVRTQ
jgi:hypothetical protein